METLTIKARSDENGLIKLEIPTNNANQEIEIVLVMQSLNHQPVDEMGYPVGYFDEVYGSMADDPLERHQPPSPDVRDELG